MSNRSGTSKRLLWIFLVPNSVRRDSLVKPFFLRKVIDD